MKYSTVVGGYYRLLGWLVVAGIALRLAFDVMTINIPGDLSCIIWLWLGTQLKRGNPRARKWAIGISLTLSSILVAMLIT